MQIRHLKIENFRSIKTLDIDLAELTAVIGGNNSGKSTILRAVELLFEAAPRVVVEDHYNKEVNLPFRITATFSSLTDAEADEFANALRDSTLTVSREFSVGGSQFSYSVFAEVFTPFTEVREESNGTKKRSLYASLRKEYDLPAVGGADEIEPALRNWEKSHPDKLCFEKVRGFFGAPNVANGKIRRKTTVQLIPAVKEAGDLGEGKRSPVLALLNAVTKQTIENKKEVQDFLSQTEEKLRSLTDPNTIPQLSNISADITDIVQRYYPDAEVSAVWSTDQLMNVAYPQPNLQVRHRALEVSTPFLGHGLQRVLIFSILQFLAQSNLGDDESATAGFDAAKSDIILLIEEPEIYQHPIKQYVIYNVIKELSKAFDKKTGIRVQIIYTTHSEKMVSMADFDAIRVVRKSSSDVGYDTFLYQLHRVGMQ